MKKYNISASALNEPNFEERRVLNKLNKTIEAFFRESTYNLDQDFQVYLSLWVYTKDGWQDHKEKIVKSDSNFIKVRLSLLLQLAGAWHL